MDIKRILATVFAIPIGILVMILASLFFGFVDFLNRGIAYAMYGGDETIIGIIISYIITVVTIGAIWCIAVMVTAEFYNKIKPKYANIQLSIVVVLFLLLHIINIIFCIKESKIDGILKSISCSIGLICGMIQKELK